MDSQNNYPSDSCIKAAKFSLFVPLILLVTTPLFEVNRSLAFFLLGLWLISFILGLFALTISLRNGFKGVKRYALPGVIIPGSFLIMTLISFNIVGDMKKRFEPYNLVELKALPVINEQYNVVINEKQGYKFELPNEFIKQKSNKKMVLDSFMNIQTQGRGNIAVVISNLGGTISQTPFSKKHLAYMKKNYPEGTKLQHQFINWNNYKVDLIKATMSLNNIHVKTYSIQLPLVKEAVQLNLSTTMAFSDQENMEMLKEILHSFKGKSNWRKSSI